MNIDHLPQREYYQLQRTTLSSKKEITNQQWEKLLLNTNKYTHHDIPSLWSLSRHNFLLTKKCFEKECNEAEKLLIEYFEKQNPEEEVQNNDEYLDLCSKISRVSVFTEFGFYAYLFIPPFTHNGIEKPGEVFEMRIDKI